MATSSNALLSVTKQNSAYLYRSDSWYGSYNNNSTPAFQSDFPLNPGTKTYFNFTSNDVGKLAIWITSVVSGFAGSVDLGSPTSLLAGTPTGWTTLFATSRDWDCDPLTNSPTTYCAMMAAAKIITPSDIGSYYVFNGETDMDGSGNASGGTNILIVALKSKLHTVKSFIPVFSTAWSNDDSASNTPQKISLSSQNVTGSTGLIEIAAVVTKNSGETSLPDVSLASGTGLKTLPIDGVVDSTDTSSNGRADGVLKYRFIKSGHQLPSYNQPTFTSDVGSYSCGGYAAIRIGG